MAAKRPTVLMLQGRSDRGGGPANVYRLLSAIDCERFRIVVACPDEEPYFERFAALPGVTVHAAELRRLSPFGLAPVARRLFRLIDDERIDILHSHGRAAGLWSRAIGSRRRAVRVVHHFRGLHVAHLTAVRRAAYLALERSLMRFTDVFVHVSASEREEGLRLAVAAAARQIVIPNGIDASAVQDCGTGELRRRLGLPPDAFVVTTVARLCHVKDLRTTAAAVGRLRARGVAVHWALVGGADEFDGSRVRAWLGAHGAADAATLAGDRDDVDAWLAASDAYVSTSLAEGLPTAVLEACAAGLPVVASDVPGNRDVIDADVGVLVPPRDPAATAAAIEALAGNPQTCARLGAGGARRVAERFTVAAMVRAHEELYARLTASADHGRRRGWQ